MMTRFGTLAVAAALATVLSVTGPARAAEIAANDSNAAAKIQAAKPGASVMLGEGTFKLGNVKIPAGVQVHGQGYGKTIIDAAGFENGFVLSGTSEGNAGAVSGLTIRNATGAGLVLDGAGSVIITDVAILGCPAGVTVAKAGKCYLSNLVIADAQSGVSFVDCTNSGLANATFADIAGTAISVSECDKVTIVNNLVAGAAFGIVLGEGNKNLAIDHNIYNTNFIGRMPGHPARKKMEAWFHLSGYDRHSQTIPVEFKDAANHDYRVVSPLPWSPTRATTAYTGAAEFNGMKVAGTTDMDGTKRGPSVDIGAYQTTFDAPRKADGTFEVKSGAGVTSAGLFTKDGVCVQYLFQNTPLPKGTYEYWLPSRDWQGREIKPGDYELRLVEADMKLRYVAAAGNGDAETSKKRSNNSAKRYSLDPQAAAFTADGRIVFVQSGFESGEHVRLFTPDMGDITWSMKGSGHAVGVAVDNETKLAYVLRQPEVRADQPARPCSLLRFEIDTGKPAPFKSGSFEKSFDEIKGAGGMTLLGDKMYISEPAANKVHILTVAADDITITGGFDVTEPTQIAADEKTGHVWVIGGNDGHAGITLLYAFDAAGKEVARSRGPALEPRAIAADNGRLTLYTPLTNTVTVYEIVNGKEFKLLRTIGVGGEGYGKIQGDKFWSPSRLALGKDGQLLVIDAPRTMLFDAEGKLVRQMLGMWGQAIGYGLFAGDDRMHFFNINGEYDIILDAKKQTWEPGTRWKYTMTSATPNFCYAAGEKTFAIYPAREKDQPQYLYITRMESDTGTARVMSRYGVDDQGLFRQSANAEGIVADDAAREYQKDAEGQPIVANFINERGFSNVDFRADGAIAIPLRKHVQIIPMTGLDANGVPVYDFTKMQIVTALADGQTTFTSPYDLTTIDDVSIAEDMTYFEDGSFIASMSTRSGPGPDLCTAHANSTNMAGFDAKGNMRWFSATNPFGLKMGLYGIVTLGEITFAGRGAICEWETMDRDGLGTGTLGTPADMGWGGMWLDNHRQTQAFIGNDGKPYLIAGDYVAQAYHWLALEGHDKLIHQRVPVTIDAALAAVLAKEPALPVAHYPVPQPPKFTIKKIDKELPADGDLAKWRTLGIKPIVIGPDQTVKNDPRDTSAVIRMAHNGDKLFVQIIKFDDVLTFHQRHIGAHYLHDGAEMCINGFYSGWKYNVTRLNGEDVVYRDRFMESRSDFLTTTQCPRKITLLDNARDVEERKMLEAARGLDMSGCKVMLIEFTLTPDAIRDMNGQQMEFGGGKSFRVGFMINDGDVPGADLMNIITWPVMYGTFSFVEEGFATATFE
ncbi:MAG: right-handed parallel beta-helix repeat-containing protein [Phycisphaerae bacterium]|nr:right-handed parallel beta-helix repeat-containing protein [Phycisphaerae bacterium]